MRYLVYDCESRPDGTLIRDSRGYPEDWSGSETVGQYQADLLADKGSDFIPVTYQVPICVAFLALDAGFKIEKTGVIKGSAQEIAQRFWEGVQKHRPILVDFNGRGFDLPLLSMTAFRYGVSCPAYYAGPKFGYRYRFTSDRIDLMEWMTEFGAFRCTGGLDLLARVVGRPGKGATVGKDVYGLWLKGQLETIYDYCARDVEDTYAVFLRTRVMTGELTLEREKELLEKKG